MYKKGDKKKARKMRSHSTAAPSKKKKRCATFTSLLKPLTAHLSIETVDTDHIYHLLNEFESIWLETN